MINSYLWLVIMVNSYDRLIVVNSHVIVISMINVQDYQQWIVVVMGNHEWWWTIEWLLLIYTHIYMANGDGDLQIIYLLNGCG